MAESIGSSQDSALALLVRAEVEWAIDGPTVALETVRAGRDLAERRGLTDMVFFFDALSLGALFDLGAWDELLQVADDIVRSSQQVGGQYAPALAQPWITQVLLWRDRHTEASETAAVASRAGDADPRRPGAGPGLGRDRAGRDPPGPHAGRDRHRRGARPGDRGVARLVPRELPGRPRPDLRDLGRTPARPTARRTFEPDGKATSAVPAVGVRDDRGGLGGPRGGGGHSTNARPSGGATTAIRWRPASRCSGPAGASSGWATLDRPTCARGPRRSSPGCKPNPRSARRHPTHADRIAAPRERPT